MRTESRSLLLKKRVREPDEAPAQDSSTRWLRQQVAAMTVRPTSPGGRGTGRQRVSGGTLGFNSALNQRSCQLLDWNWELLPEYPPIFLPWIFAPPTLRDQFNAKIINLCYEESLLLQPYFFTSLTILSFIKHSDPCFHDTLGYIWLLR